MVTARFRTTNLTLAVACSLSLYACGAGDDDDDSEPGTGGSNAAGSSGKAGAGSGGDKAGGGKGGSGGSSGKSSGGSGGKSGSDTGGGAGASGDSGDAGVAGDSGGAGEGGAGGRGEGGVSGVSGAAGEDFGGASGVGGGDGAPERCAKATFGKYLVRDDGHLLHVPDRNTQTPVRVNGTLLPLAGVVSVAEGYYYNYANANRGGHGCASLTDGSVWCWRTANGGNSNGQLGNGVTDSDEPLHRAVQVMIDSETPLGDVRSLSSGNQYSSCAVTNSGRLYCWGTVTYLINGGAALDSPYAQEITTDGLNPLSNVLQAATDLTNGCALVDAEASNEVWCWGDNRRQQLSQGDTTDRQYPVRVPGLADPTHVAIVYTAYTSGTAQTGQVTVCAIDQGNVRCWGHNTNGAAGVGPEGANVITVPTLVKVAGGTTPLDQVEALVPGNRNMCALRQGRIWCWGTRFGDAAENIGVTNVTSLGSDMTIDSSTHQLRYITSDGTYHIGGNALSPNCNEME